MNRMTFYTIEKELDAYQSLVQALPQSMFLLDKNKTIIGIFNAAPETLAGIPIEEVVGKNIMVYASDPESPFYQACSMLNSTFDPVYKTGIPLKFEYMILDSYLEATITKISEGRVLSQVRDITDIVLKQRDIERKKHNELSMALMAGGLSSWRYDIPTGMIHTQQNIHLIRSEMPIAELIEITEPEYRQKTIEMFQDIISHKTKHGHITVQLRDTENKLFWSDVHAIPHEYDIDGNVTIIIGSYKDVTKEYEYNDNLKKLVDKNELILNNTSSGFAYLNSDMKVEWENISTIFADEEITCLLHNGTLCGHSCDRLALCGKSAVLRSIDTRAKVGTKLITSQGVVAESTAQPVFDEHNNLKGVVLRIDDITVKEQTLHELALSKEKAVQSDKLKSAFLANMSHEIRTPLNSIVGFAQLIPDAESQEIAQGYIDIVKSNSETLLNLINDILDLSKIEAGYFNRNDSVFNLTELFSEIKLIFCHKIAPNVELICSTPQDECMVNLDRIRISQIITNYMTNAIKFTQKGHIKMGFELVAKGVRIYVEDTGCGMSPEHTTRVFERFEKFNKFAQGTGLGTAIAAAIVDAYDGQIGVESTLDEGTTFWAIMPTNMGEAEMPDSVEEVAAPLTPKTDRQSSMRILAAEDNDSNFMLLSAMLHEHRLTRAVNGREAVTKAGEETFDLILMDIRMPEMDGIEATQHIRRSGNNTPIIALTANAFEEDKRSAFEAGVSDFLSKPINRASLLEIIKRY